ncbi:macrophage mannose receptor 1-like [Elysia marginata]|uniref:Macrophage mannose receptor 1-like n=1 Tax=Elysia marginata TaxID=1093978 RepID=A0AAV4I4D9_9GAST|nr:macrophage mannose receptor 1-like [Elysia marginata]
MSLSSSLSTVTWIGGNTNVLKYGQRKYRTPFQVDPPRMMCPVKMKGKLGCFQASFDKKGKFVLEPNSNCKAKQPFICGYENTVAYNYNPNDYMIVDGEMTYSEAVVKCNSLKRPVASIVTAEQQETVTKLVKKFNKDVWISATYDASRMAFRWADKSFVVFNNWRDGVPMVDFYNYLFCEIYIPSR